MSTPAFKAPTREHPKGIQMRLPTQSTRVGNARAVACSNPTRIDLLVLLHYLTSYSSLSCSAARVVSHSLVLLLSLFAAICFVAHEGYAARERAGTSYPFPLRGPSCVWGAGPGGEVEVEVVGRFDAR